MTPAPYLVELARPCGTLRKTFRKLQSYSHKGSRAFTPTLRAFR
jgi:hypothetical protein